MWRKCKKKGAPACRKCKEKYINNEYRHGSKLKLQCPSNAVVNALTFIHLAGKLALIIINIAYFASCTTWACMPLKVKTQLGGKGASVWRKCKKKGAPACRKCKEKYINNEYRHGSKLKLQCPSNAVVNALTFIHLAGKLALIIINIAYFASCTTWACMPLKVKTQLGLNYGIIGTDPATDLKSKWRSINLPIS